MVAIAMSRSEPEDAHAWSAELGRLRSVFDEQFFHNISGGAYAFAGSSGTWQTVNAAAVVAAVGSTEHQKAAAIALVSGAQAHNFSLNVGAVGAKRILEALSGLSNPQGHDAALRLALVREGSVLLQYCCCCCCRRCFCNRHCNAA